jgi:hypothetical protein
MQGAMFALGAFLVGAFGVRVLKNISATGDRFDVTSNW